VETVRLPQLAKDKSRARSKSSCYLFTVMYDASTCILFEITFCSLESACMGGEPLNPTTRDNEYYSLEAIIAENQVSTMTMCGTVSLRMQQKIECTFDLDVPELGYLDNGTDENVGKRSSYISK
jgi:hypothetical protein